MPTELSISRHLGRLFKEWSGVEAEEIRILPRSGSYRQYYRLKAGKLTAMGAYNADAKENRAFVRFTEHFLHSGMHVPRLYAQDLDNDVYLLEDLGDVTMYGYANSIWEGGAPFPGELLRIYKDVLSALPKMQVVAGEGIDYSLCYPRPRFDRRAIMWDLNYFKYYFLRLAKIPFDEELLENDFEHLCSFLLEADGEHFMHRDFQTRNIMLRDGKPYFIDYQGGRKGALQYDLASILYSSSGKLPPEVRELLLEHYMEALGEIMEIDREQFVGHFYGFVLVRMMQAMGAYGLRGFYEQKVLFLRNIPHSLRNLRWILNNIKLPVELPTLMKVYHALLESEYLNSLSNDDDIKGTLNIRITSFAYKHGIPLDPSGHGGGFVFDCRSIHNPGLYAPYKHLTGRDEPVISFFHAETRIKDFLGDVYSVVEPAVEKYLSRGFENLMINFGCTGGQHRSVYCAEALARHLSAKYKVHVMLWHREQKIKEVF